MRYLKYEEVEILVTDHTSRCNLLCPSCARVGADGKINKNIYLKDISVQEYESMAPPEFYSKLKMVGMCGNYGDPIAAKNIVEVVDFFNNHNPDVSIRINTNGSLRGKSWWSKFASHLNENSFVTFSIDGLGDTSKIYRVNSNFKRVIENSKAFIEAGGTAKWDYIIFEHNYHQVEEAKNLARELGFYSFNEKVSKRFVHTYNYIHNKGGGDFGEIIKRHGSWENYIDRTTIQCRYQKMKAVYIDFDLNLWPCCWLGGPMFFHSDKNIQKVQLLNTISKYDPHFNSLRDKSIEEVLSHKWYKHDLVNSWSKTMESGKLLTCGRTCGSEYHFSGIDRKNRKETIFKNEE